MQTQRQRSLLFIVVLTAASGLAIWLANFPLADWRYFLLAAQRPFLPYATHGFYNPPWVMWFVWPLALPSISPDISAYLVRMLIVVVFVMLVHKRGGNLAVVLLTLTSAPVVAMIVSANVDWLLVLALLPGVERSLALPLLLIKPQIGLGVALVWLKAQWRSAGPRSLARFLLPLAVICLASFVVYGGWPLELLRAAELNQASWNLASFFPWGVLLGGSLLWKALKSEDEVLALLAMPLLTPYLAIYSASVIYAAWAARASLKANLLAWLLSWAGILALAVWQ